MIAQLVAYLLCALWLWPALERLKAPPVRPLPHIRRRKWAAVVLVAGRLVGVEVRLVIARAPA